jgi:ActD protein
MPERPTIYGLAAEFGSAAELLAAARQVREAGYTHTDAYSPFPIEDLAQELGARPTRLPALVLVGGIIGCVGGYLLQYIPAALAYPVDVGGRPPHSWPAFIPVTFELTILAAALTAVLGMLALNRLPMPYHPLFHLPRFALATRDRFFLAIEATDPRFDLHGTTEFLRGLGAREVNEIPR